MQVVINDKTYTDAFYNKDGLLKVQYSVEDYEVPDFSKVKEVTVEGKKLTVDSFEQGPSSVVFTMKE